MSRDDERRADDPKSFLEQATSTRDLRPLFALQRIDDLTRGIPETHPDHAIAVRIQHILKEES